MKSLEEVAKIVGMHRRVIQEYEKMGVATKPTHRTKRGYLLYDDKEISHLFLVRFYRELGYQAKEIREILSDTNYNKRTAIESQIENLKKKKQRLDDLLTIAEAIKNNFPLAALSCCFPEYESHPYDWLISLFSTQLKTIQAERNILCSDIDAMFDEVFDEDLEHYLDLAENIAENILELIHAGYAVDSPEIQTEVDNLYHSTIPLFSSSIVAFFWSSLSLTSDIEIAKDIDERWGSGSTDMLQQAIQVFCATHKNDSMDCLFMDAIDEIERLGKNKFAASSPEVQAEVQKLHQFLMKIGILPSPLNALASLGNVFGGDSSKQWFDEGMEHGSFWFVALAIQTYCKNIQESEKSVELFN